MFEREFHPLYCHDKGRPAKPIRLMVGLLILNHFRNISDESVVEQWSENNYYQYFCGGQHFVPRPPCEASELVHFRHRIGEKCISAKVSGSMTTIRRVRATKQRLSTPRFMRKILPSPQTPNCTRKSSKNVGR